MVQVQSTWFPIYDRNPQKYVDNIFKAADSDFIAATQRVYRSREAPSNIVLSVMRWSVLVSFQSRHDARS